MRYLTLDRFCNFVWWAITKDGSEREVEKFRSRLWMPPPKTIVIDPRSPWSPENETKGFAALKAQLTTKPIAAAS